MGEVSTETGALATALAKAQGQLEGATKDSRNPHLGNKYADLQSCWEACRDALSDNGLAVMQTTRVDEGGRIFVVTTLMHESGEERSGELPALFDTKGGTNPMQKLGSAITYARRYGLCAIVGVAPEDDDGQGAGKPEGRRKQQSRANGNGNGNDATAPTNGNSPSQPANPKVGDVRAVLKVAWDTLDERATAAQSAFGVDLDEKPLATLPEHELDAGLEALRRMAYDRRRPLYRQFLDDMAAKEGAGKASSSAPFLQSAFVELTIKAAQTEVMSWNTARAEEARG